MAEQRAGGGKPMTVKLTLLAFVVISAGAAIYKMSAVPHKTAPGSAATAAAAAEPARAAAKEMMGTKTAVVYYFYTNTRCSSCKTIEKYAKEAVEKNLAAGYKDWKVIFKGVNIEEGPEKHFVQDYRLSTKSVVVQQFSGGKPLKWKKLEKIWQLLGKKEAFMNYVTEETRGLLDEK